MKSVQTNVNCGSKPTEAVESKEEERTWMKIVIQRFK